MSAKNWLWANLQEKCAGRSFAWHRVDLCLMEENWFLYVVGPVTQIERTFDAFPVTVEINLADGAVGVSPLISFVS